MTPEPKHPSAAFWITVALAVVLVAYPLSFGPACWLTDREIVSRLFTWTVYHPLAVLLSHGEPEVIRKLMTDYGEWGSGYLKPPSDVGQAVPDGRYS